MSREKNMALFFVILILGLIMLVTVSGCSKQTVAQGFVEKLTLANKYLTEQKYEEAILAFQEVIKIDPKNIPARIGLAQAYVATEKFDKAEATLKDVISIDEKNVQGYKDLIKLYEKMKNDKLVIISLVQKAIEKTGDQSFKQWLEQYSRNDSKTITDRIMFNLDFIERIKQERKEHEVVLFTIDTSYLDTKTGVFYITALYNSKAVGIEFFKGFRATEKDIWKNVIVKSKNCVVYEDKTKVPENVLKEQSTDLARFFEQQDGKLAFYDNNWFGLISGDLPLEEHLKQAGVSPNSYIILN